NGLQRAESTIPGIREAPEPPPPPPPPPEIFIAEVNGRAVLYEDPNAPTRARGMRAASRWTSAHVKERARSAAFSLTGMLGTTFVVIIAAALTANLTVGAAARDGADAVGVTLRLPENAGLQTLDERSVVYDSAGNTLAVLDREVNRKIVEFEDIPGHLKQAIIAAEDRKFYEHDGYDPEGIARALVINFEERDISQGGSTITQQLAKSAPEVGTELSLNRKIAELTYAVALEEEFTKDELLEQYLNQVFFGEASYGVAAAAEEYFGHASVEDVTVDQAALLAAMIRSPNNANPRSDPELAERRRDLVLGAMVEEGYLDESELEEHQEAPLGVVPREPRQAQLPFVVDSVKREFLSDPTFAQFGETVEERERALYYHGLQIHATLDPRLQEIAKEVLQANYPPDPAQPTGALAVVEPASGRVLVAQGALEYEQEQFDLAMQGRRQPGSAAKPFVYAAALQQGFPPSVQLSGRSPAYYDNIPEWGRADGGVRNYGNTSYGNLDMRSALQRSVNTATVQLSQVVGIERVADLMDEMGINTDAALTNPVTGQRIVNPSIALGGLVNGTTPLEMATAYATFANGGVHIKPHLIERITDRNGRLLYVAQHPGEQVLDPAVNGTMINFLQATLEPGGTGGRARIPNWPVAGKTGTTQDNKDAWFVGATPNMATAMWMGHARQGAPMPGITGGSKPATVWQQFMSRALEGIPPQGFPEAPQITDRLVPGEPVQVPDVRRLSEADALAALGKVRLFGEVRLVPSLARQGTVASQSPDAGTTVQTGDTVVVHVSSGPPPPPPPPEPSPDQPDPAPQPDEPAPPQPDQPAPAPQPDQPAPAPPGNEEGPGNGGGPPDTPGGGGPPEPPSDG
ncbi:MAG: PASTA domain-containing protein, partial [Nitriliruptorales bacterium]|nr:PASTA domain-containing protein [Nitriliruptorales bacterium]